MNLEQNLHERWAAVPALEAVMPAARLFTGRIPIEIDMPCGRLYVSQSTITKRSNRAVERQVHVRFQHWTEEGDYLRGRTIQTEIEEAFDNYDTALDDSVLVNLRHEQTSPPSPGRVTFLQHRPYQSRGVFLDVSGCFSTREQVLGPETWCHAVSAFALTFPNMSIESW